MAIIDLAEAFHIPIVLHMGMASPIMIAATLQVAAATAQVKLVEFQPVVLGAANQILRAPITCDGGLMGIPSGPGLGIEIDDTALRKFTVD
jgi:galactonate dehydratase